RALDKFSPNITRILQHSCDQDNRSPTRSFHHNQVLEKTCSLGPSTHPTHHFPKTQPQQQWPPSLPPAAARAPCASVVSPYFPETHLDLSTPSSSSPNLSSIPTTGWKAKH